MKIALFQMHADDDRWSAAEMPALLSRVAGVDLAVFPECMPFTSTGKSALDIHEAAKILGSVSADIPFVAGGYVNDSGQIRNAAFLVESGRVLDVYFKRRRWRGERFSPGDSTKLFRASKATCIPLICADAGDDAGPDRTRMMYETITAGAGPSVPIVVCSYGAFLRTPYWRNPLKAWAANCNAPVAVCGVAGRGKQTFRDDGKTYHYGGGGSGVFWPDGEISEQPTAVGVLVVDTARRSSRFIAHGRSADA